MALAVPLDGYLQLQQVIHCPDGSFMYLMTSSSSVTISR